MIGVAQMTEFVQEHVIAERFGQTDQVQIQVDVSFRGATSPVRGIVLDRDAPICETIPLREEAKFGRKESLGLAAQEFDQRLAQVRARREMYDLPKKGTLQIEVGPMRGTDIFYGDHFDPGIRIFLESDFRQQGMGHGAIPEPGDDSTRLFSDNGFLSLPIDRANHPIPFRVEKAQPFRFAHKPGNADAYTANRMNADAHPTGSGAFAQHHLSDLIVSEDLFLHIHAASWLRNRKNREFPAKPIHLAPDDRKGDGGWLGICWKREKWAKL